MSGKGYFSGLRFLVVDDSPFMRELIREVLRHFDVREIRQASDGAEALEVMMVWSPDVILVDWEMAPFDGIEFTRSIRSSDRGSERFTPIIMVSAHSEYWRVQHARNAGVNEFLVKPVSPKSLFSRVRAVIERPRQFVKAPGYFGPDRRRRQISCDVERRATDQPQATPISADEVMGQGQINALFNPGSNHPDDRYAQ